MKVQPESGEARKDRKLQQARKMFLQGCLKQLNSLEGLLNDLEQRWDADQAKHVYHIAHTLKGSAPVFGYWVIGKLAESLQHIWEWSQHPVPDRDAATLVEGLENYIHVSKGYLLRLKQAYEAGVKEIEMDERQVNGEPEYRLPEKNRLLLIDDDDVFRSYLVEKLRLKGYEVDEACDVQSAKQKLHEKSFDLITLDLLMYPDSGYKLFEFLKEDPTLKWLPVIVLSGKHDLQDKVRCLRLGADDYVVKPFQFAELEARIFRLLMRATLLEQMAFRDALTGVYNRRYFYQQAEFEIHRVKRSGQPISIAFIDLDHFKRINDNFGHQVGDLALQAIADILRKNLRAADLLARYGGEEFVVLLPDTSPEEAVNVIGHTLEVMRNYPVLQNNGMQLYFTFSAGVAGWKQGLSAAEWIQMADDAAYEAKKQGRNQVVLSSGELSTIRRNVQPVKKKVLIADDDPLIRSLLKSRLQIFPVVVLEASDGEQAVELLRQEAVDLLILDGVMPKRDGFSVLKWVRSDESRKDLKIMILSGLKSEEDVVKGLSLGADDYLSKPFSLPELELRVKRLLGLP